MNKWLLGITILMLIWVVKLSWDLQQLKTIHISNLNMQMSQQTQQVGRLNDEFVALQNRVNTSEPSKNALTANNIDTQSIYSATEYYSDRISLTQIALDQQQFTLALDYIQELRQKLAADNTISDTLKNALMLALVRDQASIVSYLQQRSEHLQLIHQELAGLDKLLKPQLLDNKNNKWDLKHWFSLEKATETPDLMQRELFYQKLEFKLLLAQQALVSGQIKLYKTEISELIKLVALQPDEHAKTLSLQLRKIQQLNLGGLPQMTAASLMRKI